MAPQQPSFRLWEGVVMYLSDAAPRETLRELAELSAPGSRLLVNYHEPEPRSERRAWTHVLTRWLGEPQIGLRRREQMLRELSRAGFRVLHDSPIHPRSRVARLLVAERALAGNRACPPVCARNT